MKSNFSIIHDVELKIKTLVVLFFAMFLFVPGNVDAENGWTRVRNVPEHDFNVRSVDMDSSGSKIILPIYYGRLYQVENNYTDVSELTPVGEVNKYWYETFSSYDGEKIIVFDGSTFFISSDAGVSWSSVSRPGGGPAMSNFAANKNDGSTILTGYNYSGRLYLSRDSGATWQEKQPAGNTSKYWNKFSVSDDGRVMTAATAGSRAYVSIDYGETWNEIQPAGDINASWFVKVSGDGSRVVAVVQSASESLYGKVFISNDNGQTWSNYLVDSGTTRTWRSIDISSNGQVIYAASMNGMTEGNLFISRDFGANWTETALGGNQYTIIDAIKTNASGTVTMICSYPGDIYVSNNSGQDWTDFTSLSTENFINGSMSSIGNVGSIVFSHFGNNNSYGRSFVTNNSGMAWSEIMPVGDVDGKWRLNKISSDGSKIIIIDDKRAYLSNNGGQSWSEIRPAGNVDKSWQVLSANSDFSKIIIGTGTDIYDGVLYISDDGGQNWSITAPVASSKAWKTVTISADGSKIIAGVDGRRLYLSNNGGQDWSEIRPAGNVDKYWAVSSMSTNGQVIMVGEGGGGSGRLYLSGDGGQTWAETLPAGGVDKYWKALSISPDGSHVIVGSYSGRLFISSDGGQTWAEEQPMGNVNADWNAAAINNDGSVKMALAAGDSLYVNMPQLSFSLNSDTVSEQADIKNANIALPQTNVFDTVGTLSLSGTAVYGVDYTLTTTSVKILTGETATSVPVTIINNDYDSTNKTIIMSLIDGVRGGSTMLSSTTLTIVDDDVAGIIPSLTTLNITRSGNDTSSDSIYVRLNTKPTANVTLTPTLSSTNALTFNQPTLTFTSSSWNTSQNLIVYTVSTSTATSFDLTFSVSSEDTNYNNLSSNASTTVAITITNRSSSSTGSGGGSGCSGLCGGGGGSSTPNPTTGNNVPTQISSTNQVTVITSPLTQTVTNTAIFNNNNTSATLVIPPNTITTPATLSIVPKESISVVLPSGSIDTFTKPLGDVVFDITLKDNTTNQLITSFNSKALELVINLPSLPSDQDTTTLGLYYLNETTNQWLRVNDAVFDTINKQVITKLNHLTKFAVFKSGEFILDTINTTTTPIVVDNNNSNIITTDKSKLDKKFAIKQKGKILLQVEDKGQAYYVNPKDYKRYYMASGTEAYMIMRKLGVGITNNNLNKLKNNKTLAKKQAGKIFLQVEVRGEAYYVSSNGTLHYLKDGAEAYNLMRKLGVGIKTSDLYKIEEASVK